jgi:hypothetical protein
MKMLLKSEHNDIENGKAKSAEDKYAPNISLNLHGLYGNNNIIELALLALFGIILQVGALVFSGFTAYDPYLMEKLEGPMVNVGFPLQAAGTLFLSLSMMLCSFVIVNATDEKRWWAKGNDAEDKNSSNSGADPTERNNPVRILWLQKKGVIGDQSLGSFLLMARGTRDEIFTSRRSTSADKKEKIETSCWKWLRKYLDTLTVIGVAIGILGFIAQFEGFRLSNWSSAIAQLVAMFLMTNCRALVRRGLNESPAHKPLPENYEIDWLALKIAADTSPDFLEKFSGPEDTINPENHTGSKDQIEFLPFWHITTPNSDRSNLALRLKTEATQERGEKAFAIRKRLGKLTRWVGPPSKEADTIATAIEVVMNRLLSSESQKSFTWRLKVSVDWVGSLEEIEFGFEPYNLNDKKPWRAVVAEIEAALSLWKYCTSKNPYKRCRRVLGPDTDALRQDLAWWMGDGVVQESRANHLEQRTNETLWVGFNGLEPKEVNPGELSKP